MKRGELSKSKQTQIKTNLFFLPAAVYVIIWTIPLMKKIMKATTV